MIVRSEVRYKIGSVMSRWVIIGGIYFCVVVDFWCDL